ncbi:tolloid-like protein 1 [Saccoglossus kowalevskii]
MKLPARVALLALLLLPAIHTTVAFDVDFGVAINDVTSSVSTIIGVYDPTCPDGWEYQILGDRCLKIYTEAASWHDANAVCGSHGGSLVMVQGFTANLEVGVMAFTTLGYGNSMWIGYNRIGNNYYWASGDEAELLDGFWSATGLEYGEGCVGIDLEVSGSCPWLLRNCEIQLPYMCEMRPILEDDFVCCNGQHILGSYECDGMEDCNDGTDEIDCQDAVYGGSMTGTYGEITSPGFPDNYYPNNLNCRWQIIAPFGSRIKIRVTDLNTELGYDVLKLYDGCGYDNLVEMLSGYYGPTYEVMSTNNIVKIQFTSDGSGSYEGFSLTWESVEEECGGTFDATTDPVDLFSPGFVLNNEYPHDEECVWILKVYKEDCGSGSRSGSRTGSGRRGSRGSGGASANGCKDDDVITLQFYDFETEYINDVVYVDDGKSPNSNRRLGEISGTDWEYMPGPFISSKSEMYIRFSSDSEDQYDGFSASYKSGMTQIG